MSTYSNRLAGALAAAITVIPTTNDGLRAQESWGRIVSMAVVADPTDIYGRSWDGIGSQGGVARGALFFIPHLISPPDLGVCVVTSDLHSCYHDEKDGSPASRCHDAFDCEWTIRVPDQGAYGLIVYDIDNLIDGQNDLIDVLLITDGTKDLVGLETRVRRLTEELSRTTVGIAGRWTVPIAPGEGRRRERVLPVRAFEDCATESWCRLQQSSFQLRPAGG